MKVYPTRDVFFFAEYPSQWEVCCRYPNGKKWSTPPPLDKVRSVKYYRDIEGAWMHPDMNASAYYLKKEDFLTDRIIPWACLPLIYALGERFIKLEKAPPGGFKCRDLPMNLREYKAKKQEQKGKKKKKKKSVKKGAKKQTTK